MKVRKAIIPAAGWGTRFLPVTKSQPKEMLPLINKPLIQYAVEEAIDSGIEQVILITAMGKNDIEDYFDRSFELEQVLEQKGEHLLLREVKRLCNLVDICYIRQKQQLGLGHAVLMARNVIADEPFAVILPDDVIDSTVPALKQMIDVWEQQGTSVIAVQRVRAQHTLRYGIIEAEEISSRMYRVLGMVEKPAPEEAPSDLGIVGRYILTPEIFNSLSATVPGRIKEIQLTDALQDLLKIQAITACQFDGIRYDTGNPAGWLEANIALAIKDPAIGRGLRDYLYRLLR
jgi:UTP--glucose-1-phosphate uridylyltransferase